MKNKTNKWWTLGTVCFALLMIVLDGNVVNLAIPQILKNFGATIAQIEWVNNAYLLAFAIFLITFGRLGDAIGRKKMFIGGLFAFVIGSILCGIAGNIDQLIIFRAIQGLGGAAMMPATLSLIATNFEKKERGTAMGLWGAVAGLGIVLGPIIGGYLTDKGLGSSLNSFFHITEFWRYVFYINLPIGILAIIAAFIFIPESKDNEKKHSYDLIGIVLSAISIFFLTFGFIEGTKYGWWIPNESFIMFGKEISIFGLSITPISFMLSLISGVIFFFYEKSLKKDPLVDLKLFTRRNFSVGNASATILSFGMMGAFFLLPLFLQIVMGFAPIKTGQILLPFALTIMITAPISGKLADKIGGKILVFSGLIIMAIGSFYIGHFTVDTTIKQLIFPFIIMGIGMGLTQAPLTNITLLDTPDNEVGGASGVLSTARQVGSIMGIAILGAYLQTVLASNIEKNIKGIQGLPDQVDTVIIESVKSQGLGEDSTQLMEKVKKEFLAAQPPVVTKPSPSISDTEKAIVAKQQEQLAAKFSAIGQEIQKAVKLSFVESINKTFMVAALIALFGAAVSLLFKKQK